MAFPFYLALQNLFPQSKLHLLGKEWAASLMPPRIFDECFTFAEKHLEASTLNQLKKNSYDLGISLSPSFRSVWLFTKIRASIRLGYRTDLRNFLIKVPQKIKKYTPRLNPYEHRSLSYLRLLTSFFEDHLNAEDYWQQGVLHNWDLTLSPQQEKRFQNVLRKHKIKAKEYWVICPGSAVVSRVYPIKYVAGIVKTWAERKLAYKIVFVGTGREKKYMRELFSYLDLGEREFIEDLTTKTDLTELAFLLKQARGVIANDSGVAHLSFLTKTPLVTFIGAGRKEEILSLNPIKVVLNQKLACSPCLKPVCPRKDFPLECLIKIPPEMVWNAMKKLDQKL